ncbi:hypothetical protein HJC23_002761 [Cyclotella cryptica]|uniref:F-box domain-containing protein n=1 Tax=Cyclotella cryptica TaxID=29204 RepID=A0ABD3PQF9_9STRA
MRLIELPDEILHAVFTFVANSPCLVGPCLCWNLRQLSEEWRDDLDTGRHDLWALAASDLSSDSYSHDLCHAVASKKATRQRSRKRAALESGSTDEPLQKRIQTHQNELSPRRSTRLRPSTPKESYIHAYNLLLSRTESAVLQIAEHAHSSKDSLTLSKLKYVLKEHGPVAVNQRVRTGGTFLVEVNRARHVSEGVILKCIKLLVEEYGANPNVPSAEFASVKNVSISRPSGNATSKTACSTSTVGNELYPLIIAAARGMPTVVKYLLDNGADASLRGSSRFRLFSNPKKTVRGEGLTALEFAQRMWDEEMRNGLERRDMKGLQRTLDCLKLKV